MIIFRSKKQGLPWVVVCFKQKEDIMEKLLRCRDFGSDCDFEACGETAEEALETAVNHARSIHGLKDISEKDRMRAKSAVQDAFCVPKGGYNPGGGGF